MSHSPLRDSKSFEEYNYLHMVFTNELKNKNRRCEGRRLPWNCDLCNSFEVLTLRILLSYNNTIHANESKFRAYIIHVVLRNIIHVVLRNLGTDYMRQVGSVNLACAQTTPDNEKLFIIIVWDLRAC